MGDELGIHCSGQRVLAQVQVIFRIRFCAEFMFVLGRSAHGFLVCLGIWCTV